MDSPTLSSSQAPTSGVRLLAAGMGGLAIYVGAVWLIELHAAGFPDGHLTPYARAVHKPFTFLSWLSLGSSLYFLHLARTAARPARATHLAVAILAYLLFIPGAHCGIEYGLKRLAHIDSGQGG